MALIPKLSGGLVQQRSTITTNDEGVTTETQTWTGPYSQLLIKQNAVRATAKSTSLSPTEADGGVLTITYETAPTDENAPPDVIELIWAELRLPVTQHPAFKDIPADRKKAIKTLAETEDATAPSDADELKLYNLLAAGTTEYAVGAPVVRRTRTRRRNPGGGGAWIRETPPALAPAGYEWLKTANETRKEGKSYTHTEEWTGAETWDAILYPADS